MAFDRTKHMVARCGQVVLFHPGSNQPRAVAEVGCVPLHGAVPLVNARIFCLLDIWRFLLHVWGIRSDKPLKKLLISFNDFIDKKRVYHGVQ